MSTPRTLGLLTLVALLGLDRSASAYNSKCTIFVDPTGTPGVPYEKGTAGTITDLKKFGTGYSFPCDDDDKGEPGPLATHGRLVEFKGQDEHAAIFRAAAAGLPKEILDPLRLRVFTSADPAGSAKIGSLPSFRPVAFESAKRVRTRAFGADELAMLPDFSYALWDWMDGNESCPLPGYEADGAIRCHAFKEHMGAANANHFPPLADQSYARLHGIAVARAKECAALGAGLGGDRERFLDYVLDCEKEAIAIEAVAQHYLQDAWSAGHGWQRWGASDIARFPAPDPSYFNPGYTTSEETLFAARIVGLSAGWVHGSEPVGWFNDAMCSPFPDIRMKTGGGLISAVGDMHFGKEVMTDSTYSAQKAALIGCVAGSVGEVYAAFGSTPAHGAASTASMPAGCTGMRATNQAMFHGIGQDLPLVGHAKPSDFTFRYAIVPVVLSKAGLKEPLSPVGVNNYDYDWMQLGFVAAVRAAEDPDGTDMSSLQVSMDGPLTVSMLGVSDNSAYATDATLTASYQDPTLPWPSTPDTVTPSAAERAKKLALAFHRGHVKDWCGLTTSTQLAALKSNATAAMAGGSAEERAAACEVCTQITARHLRVGAPGKYNTKAEPVCNVLVPSSPVVYEEPHAATESVTELAARYCGCAKSVAALTDAGVQLLDLSAGAVSTSGAVIPTPKLPRNGARTGDGRLLVTHGDGSLVVLDLDAKKELDTDDDPTTTTAGAPTGVTRIATGVTDLLGVAIGHGPLNHLYGFVTAPGTDELLVIDLGWPEYGAAGFKYEIIKRINVGADGAVNEQPADIVVTPDNKRIYVSFKAGVGRIAVVDFSKATDRYWTSGGEVLKHIPVAGSNVAIEALALSPDGSKLAVTNRHLGITCPDTIRNKAGSTVSIGIACDNVRILDTATDTFITFPTGFNWISTKPVSYPKGLAWLTDGRVAIASFDGPEPTVTGGWPAVLPLGANGTVMIADPSTGKGTPHAAVNPYVIGQALVSVGDYLYVGTTSGDVTALPTTSTFWSTVATIDGKGWYGGCITTCTGGTCPVKCPTALSLGSPIRALVD